MDTNFANGLIALINNRIAPVAKGDEDAAPAAMIEASNHFEVAIATVIMLFDLSSGAALASVVGVLIKVPVMLMLVGLCKKTTHWFEYYYG